MSYLTKTNKSMVGGVFAALVNVSVVVLVGASVAASLGGSFLFA